MPSGVFKCSKWTLRISVSQSLILEILAYLQIYQSSIRPPRVNVLVMLLRHLSSFNVTKSYESHSKQANWPPSHSKPIAKGSIRKEAYLCELNANHFLVFSPSLPLSYPTHWLWGQPCCQQPYRERPMWQGMEASCQKPPANSK